MKKTSRIFVAGHRGLVGSGVVRSLKRHGYTNLALRAHSELDLMDQRAVNQFFETESIEYVVDCAAKVGGIKANMTHPSEFLYQNLQIQNNLIWAAKESGVSKFLFLGSSCIYPRDCPQPMNEDEFMQGRPEPTNEAYAYAKIAGIKLCEYIHAQYGMDFISCMPTNIYGIYDNFDPETSHVIPSLMRRIHEAKDAKAPEVSVWGTGSSRREFLYVDDLADAVVWLLQNYDGKQFLNIGTGEDISIKELALTLKDLIGYQGDFYFDSSKPDGMPKKLLDVHRIQTAGWRHSISFDEGLTRTYEWFRTNIAT